MLMVQAQRSCDQSSQGGGAPYTTTISLSPAPHPGCERLWSYLTDSCENGGVGHHLEGKKKDKVQTTGVCNREKQTLTLKVAAAI